MGTKKILVVVVTYYPEKDLLERNIQAYIDFVDKVLVWENTPENDKLKYRHISHEKVEYCGDGVNSISRALNYAWRYADRNGYDYLLTMDQDSLFEDFRSYLGKTVYCEEAPEGIWTPPINNEETSTDYEEINMPITSGMLASVRIINLIGGWNEYFTIDSVDDEFFLQAYKCNVRKYRVKGVSFIQRYGSPNTVKWMGHTLVLRNDGPKRLYSIYKNKLMLIRRYPDVKYLRDEFFHYWPKVILLVLLFEKDKFSKVWAIIRGLASGFSYKVQNLRMREARRAKDALVLMSTYNGELYLEEQLDSILCQEGMRVSLLIRDDGSTDGTCKILERYAAGHDNIRWITAENIGFVKSFSKLIEMALADEQHYDFYAFSDQDDVWFPQKMTAACGALEYRDQQFPLVFMSNSLYVDDNLNELGLFYREPPYLTRQNVILYPTAQGCSMVFNRRAMELYMENPPSVAWHDRWMGLICNFFGETDYCQTPLFYYRIHGNNTIGKKKNFFGRIIDDFKFYFSSDPKNYPMIKEFYDAYQSRLSEDDRKAINTYLQYKKSLKAKLVLMTSRRYQHTLNWWDVVRKSVLFLFNRG